MPNMKVDIKKLSKSQVELNFEIPVEELEKFFERACFELGKDLEVKVNGFRQGRAPREIVEKIVGKEKVFQKASELAIRESYLRAIFENKIEAISQPKIEILKMAEGNPFEFRATVSVLPQVDLPDYKKIASQVKKRGVSVQEKEVQDSLNWLQKSRTKFIFQNRPCQKGDFVEIEFTQSITNEKSQDAFILGKGHLIPGMEKNLLGMSPGEEKKFWVKFPKTHFRKEFAGKKVELRVKMKSVQIMELPEINDQFAQSLGRFENLKALKDSIKEGIYREKEIAESQRVRGEILEKISQETKVEIPDILLDREKNQMIENLKTGVNQILKIPFEDYLNRIKKTEKELLDSFSVEAKKRIKNSLVLREIGKKEKIEVSEEEVKAEINEVLKHYPSVEKAKKELDLARLKKYTRETIRNDKTLAMLESFVQK